LEKHHKSLLYTRASKSVNDLFFISNSRQIGPYRFKGYRAALKFLIKSYVKKPSLILDAGCGDGWLLLDANTQGIGLDVNRENIRKANKAKKKRMINNLHFIVADICHIPLLEHEIFDVIVCCDALEHVKESELAISELSSYLKKKGKFLITTSNSLNPIMLLDRMLPTKISNTILLTLGEKYYPRTRRYNPYNLQQTVNRYKLRVCKLFMFASPPFAFLFSRRAKTLIPILIVGRAMFYIWIAFDKMTNHFLKYLKECILVIATK